MTAVIKTGFPDQARYRSFLEQALTLAKSSANRVFLRFYTAIDVTDVWPQVNGQNSDQEVRLAWADGRREQSFWAVGKVAEIPCTDFVRFARARRDSRDFSEQTLHVVPENQDEQDWGGIPLGIGGFSFVPCNERAHGVWDGWEDGVLWVPRLLFYRSKGRSVACLTLVVEPNQELSEIWICLEREFGLLEVELSQLSSSGDTSCVDWEASEEPDKNKDAISDNENSKKIWCERVQRATNAIRKGDFDKVVLARAEEWVPPNTSVFDAVQTAYRLRSQYPTCKVFLMKRSDGSAFVGATPELLVALDRDEVDTVSLAGTSRRGGSEQEDRELGQALIASTKEQHEHRLVTEAIHRSFESLVVDLVIDQEPHLLRLPNVQHLETRIRGKLSRTHGILELVSRLHPTPAVGGAPVGQALAWLKDNEDLDRGWYAGSVGWVTSRGDGLFAVAIRSALLRPDRAWAFVGAGLVEDSDPEQEWDETNFKLQAMRKSLVTRRLDVPQEPQTNSWMSKKNGCRRDRSF